MKIKTFKTPAIGLLALIVMGCGDDKPDIVSSRDDGVMKVDYIVVKPTGVANVLNVSGTLLATESAMLSAQTAGKVTDILFDEGEKVQKGQILVRLDDRALQAQQKMLDAQLKTAKKDLERKQGLAEIQGVSAAEIDDATLKVSNLQAQKDEIDVKLDHTTIRAPFSGTIGLRSISPGSYLAAGDPVAELVKRDPLKLQFNIPEKYATQVKEGQTLRFGIDGNQKTYKAEVYAAASSIDPATRALSVRAKAPNKKGELIPGAFADVVISLDSIPDGLMVPTDAIVPQLNEQMVYQIENGKVNETRVQTGIRKTATVQITEGLQAGDTVMMTGLLQARQGLPVRPGKEITLETME